MAIITSYINSLKFFSTIPTIPTTPIALIIPATDFIDNSTNAAATAFPSSYKYFNLYINGIPQYTNLQNCSVTASGLTIIDTTGLTQGHPVALEFIVT